MEDSNRPLTEPRASRGLRRRLLRHYLPLALGSAVVLFLHWFLQEQREEVSSMSHLLATLERAGENLLIVEKILARTGDEESPLAAGAPPAAGGALLGTGFARSLFEAGQGFAPRGRPAQCASLTLTPLRRNGRGPFRGEALDARR